MKRLAVVALAAAAACGDRPPSSPSAWAPPPEPETTVAPASAPPDAKAPSGEGLITPWLEVKDKRIRLPNGKPFHGRGANVHDTRACDSCSFAPPVVSEVLRRIDVLTDEWNASFLRLLLEAYPDDGRAKIGNARTHYRNILDDEDYFRDVMRMIGHVGKKKGVYVLVSLWQDPTFTPLGWPSAKTALVWKKLAGALRDMPFVMFGIVNEPKDNWDGKQDAEVWAAMNGAVAAIRSVERPERPHVVTVQGTRDYGRSLDYYVTHPITAGNGVNVAYETHVYNRANRFDELVVRPARSLPVVIGEMGPLQNQDVTMFPEDCTKLWDVAERHDVPWLAWSFHNNCPPNLVTERKNQCIAGAPLEPTPWGRMTKARLAHKW
ncbi:MAG: cellulase family glycosylhydrolase [Labilithrix sp.]|nr:cellulase family glycosylhydrolase [Labilithrix sp.]MCW5812139.1 cellulase family glycosylhydrolase [Labilithrix sp.]